MKNITSLFILVLLLVGTFGFVAAAETEDSVPSAEKVGFFSNQMFKLKYALTFDKEKKIEMALDMAERRLAEAELLAEEDPEAYDAAQEKYNELVARAEGVLSDIKSNDEDINKSIAQIEKIARIENMFEKHRDHIDEIYTRALDRFVINNASEEKIERFEMFHERALNRTDSMEEKILEKKENTVRKHKALSEMSDEELDALLEKIEDNEGLTQAREERAEKFEERTQKIQEKGLEIDSRIRERINNSNMTEEQKANFLERLDTSRDKAGEISEKARERMEEQKRIAEQRAEDFKNRVEEEKEKRANSTEDDYESESDNEAENETETNETVST